ncbi:hypothetical protein TFLX_04711 [Thermoflexales bacterium]|nr:hypothetical protein TFLX_04711 [Thermoflexales bacterium]
MNAKVILAGLILGGLLVVGIGCQAADPPPAADLMFCANQAVFSITLGNDGKTEMRKVVDLPEDATCPVWSPDGKFAVLYRYRQLEPFVQEDSLSLIDRQTGTIHEVYRFGPSDNEWTIHWLPEGVELLLASARDELKQDNAKCDPDVRSFNHIRGLFCWAAYADFYQSRLSLQKGLEGFERLTDSSTLRCSLEWSPDGSQLAFAHGSMCSEGVGEEGNISVLDLNKRTVSVVVDAAAYLAEHRGGSDRNEAVSWSPNGKRLAISSYQYDGVTHTSRINIADSVGVHPIVSEQASWIDWLPDGKELLWFNGGLGVADIESGTVQTLPISLDPRQSIDNSVLSPDGRYLTWRETFGQDKTRQIRIFDFAEGTASTVLNILPGTLVWSPDSQMLAFPVKTRLNPNTCDYQIDIYVVKPDASGLRNLTEGQPKRALSCSFSGGMGWRWYGRFVKDVQWVTRN